MGTHPGLPGDTSGNDNDVSTSKSLLETIVRREEACDLGRGGDVGKIGSDTRCVDDIIEAQL